MFVYKLYKHRENIEQHLQGNLYVTPGAGE